MIDTPHNSHFRSSPVRWVVRRFFQLCGLVLVLVWVATAWLWVTSFTGFPDSLKRAFGYAPNDKLDKQALLSTGHYWIAWHGDDCYMLNSVEGRIFGNYWVNANEKYKAMYLGLGPDKSKKVIRMRRAGLSLVWVPYYSGVARSLCRNTFVYTPKHSDIGLSIAPSLSFPHWLLLLVLSIPALFVARSYHRAWRAYQRRKKGLCEGCGYNLSGNVSELCPECGIAFGTAVPP